MLLCNEEGLKKMGAGVQPLAFVRSLALAGDDPVTMLDAPIPATRKALDRAGLSIGEIDLYGMVIQPFRARHSRWKLSRHR